MANTRIYPQTKVGANRPRSGGDTSVCVSKMMAICHHRFVAPPCWTTHNNTLDSNYLAYVLMIRSDVIKISQFYNTTDLPMLPLLRSYCGTIEGGVVHC